MVKIVDFKTYQREDGKDTMQLYKRWVKFLNVIRTSINDNRT